MEDTDPKSSASAPAAVQCVFLSFLLEVLQQFLLLVFALHMLGSTLYVHLDLLSTLEMIGLAHICRYDLPSLFQIAWLVL